jgi:hypothetical protein
MSFHNESCRRIVCTLLLGLVALATPAHAHKPSDSYLSVNLTGDTVAGRWDVALRDLDFVLDLDTDRDGRLTWGELRGRLPEVERYTMQHVALASDGARCDLGVRDRLIDNHTDGGYIVLELEGSCPHPPHVLGVRYDFLLGVDTTHRGLLSLAIEGESQSAVLDPAGGVRKFASGHNSGWNALASYFTDGVHHIWTGYDHLLFLCSLLLPAVAFRQRGRWAPASRWQPVALDVLRTVSAFTLAHSLTLLLATTHVIDLPSRAVESAIALTVILAALNNVFPLVDARRWVVALGFGLIHGFGFASVLAGLDLPGTTEPAIALLGFNLGVEAGQVTVVAVLLPALFAVRGTTFYRHVVLTGGSCTVALIAVAWFLERSLDMRFFPA